MRILYLSQYFPPEIGATQTRAFEMARGLVKAGHQVTMICEFPNHPTGIMPPAYRGKLYERETMDGVQVIRVWVKASPEKSFGNRMAFYLSFMFMAVVAGLFLARGRYDGLYATTPPLFTGAAGLILSYLRRAPFFLEVRDLWPESAVELGELSSPRAIRWATWLEERCYGRARHMVVATRGIRDRLVERGIDPARMTVITNGANTELYTPRPADPALRQELGIGSGQFVVTYTGLHGLAHGLETVMEAADLLRDEVDVLFLMVGDGPEKGHMQQIAAEKGLSNVIFHSAVPEEVLVEYLALADAGLDTRKRIGISTGTLPVKMFSYMACGKPVILAIEGEASELMAEARAGIVAPPESARAIADAVLALKADPEQRKRYGENGRAYVEAHYSRQVLASRLERLLDEQVNGETRS